MYQLDSENYGHNAIFAITLHFHCLCFVHFKEFLSNPSLKITLGLAQKIPHM